jgi:hypothetical protein
MALKMITNIGKCVKGPIVPLFLRGGSGGVAVASPYLRQPSPHSPSLRSGQALGKGGAVFGFV